jgi:zinc transporter 1
MNIHGVFLHVMSDALGSVVVMISASIIYFTQDPACHISLSGETAPLPASCGVINWTWYIDPFLSLILVFIILVSTWPLLRDSTLILLNTVPQHIDVNDLETRLLQRVEGVTSVHELHVWRLVGSRVVASCHLEISTLPDQLEPLDYHMVLAREVKLFFHSCGIHSTTIQLEYPPSPTRGRRKGEFHYQTQDKEEPGCQLECPKGLSDPDCVESSCCKKRIVRKENTDATNRELYRKETDFDSVTHM